MPQLLLGFSVEPLWGLMGDCQAPLNRILIIQLQQEFSPLGLSPRRYLHLHLSIFPALAACSPSSPPPLLPAPLPTVGDSGLSPGGPGRAWYLPPTATGRTAPALGESPAVGSSSKVCMQGHAWPDPTWVLGREGVPTFHPAWTQRSFPRVIEPRARLLHNECLM